MEDEDREHYILPREEFLKMLKEYEEVWQEPPTVNHHRKQLEALDVAISALARIEAIHYYEKDEFRNTVSREMNNVASEALLKISGMMKR